MDDYLIPVNDGGNMTDDAELMAVLSQIGAEDLGVQVGVYRQLGQGKKLAYVCAYTPSEFNLDRLRDDHGGGDYRIQVRRDGGLIANRGVSIEDIKRNEVATTPVMPNTGGVDQLAAAMLTGFQELGKLIIQSAQSRSDPAEERRTMLQEMQLMAQIMQGTQSKATGGELDIFLKGIEFAKNNTGEAKDDNVMGVLKETIATLGPAIAQAASRTPALSAPHIERQPTQEDDPMFLMKYYLNMLVSCAAENRDPALYAELVVDQAPEELLTQIENNPALIDELVKVEPRIGDYRQWFGELLVKIKEVLQYVREDDNVNQSSNGASHEINKPPIGNSGG